MIIFQKVSKEFGPEDFALQDVSFSVHPGELVFVTGASGSGKTTLMRLLTKEATPTEGEIFFGDQPLSKIKAGTVHKHRRKIGVVFQDYRLLPELNVWENVALPLFVSGQRDSEVEERVTDLLRLVQLTHKADLFPSQLSGGEAQRISIARALASGPEVIFADEPTGNLDSETAQHIAELLVKINELGTTIFFATHDHRFLENYPKHHRLHLEEGTLLIDSLTGKETVQKSNKTEKAEAKYTRQEDTKSETAQSKPGSISEKQSVKTSKPAPKAEAIEETADQTPETALQTTANKKSLWQRLFGKKNSESPAVADEAIDTDEPAELDDSSSDEEPAPKTEKSQSHPEKSRTKDSKKSTIRIETEDLD